MRSLISDGMKKSNIGILTFPISEAGNIPLSNPSSNDFYLITGNI